MVENESDYHDVSKCLIQTCERVDCDLYQYFELLKKRKLISEKDFHSCGAVGIIVLILNHEKVLCANLGDCRALLFAISNLTEKECNEYSCEMVEMSRDFKAGYEKERMLELGVKVVPGLPSRSVSNQRKILIEICEQLDARFQVWRFSIQTTSSENHSQQTTLGEKRHSCNTRGEIVQFE